MHDMTAAATACRVDDWISLPGSLVELRQAGRTVRKGLVDAATTDGKIVWIAQDGALERMLVDKTVGFEIWIAPA